MNYFNQLLRLQNKLLSQYIEENQVLQCPKCKQFSEKDCSIQEKQIQQCYYCSLKFCMVCKSQDKQLFPSILFNSSCCPYCCEKLLNNSSKAKNLFLICSPIIILIVISIVVLFVLLAPLLLFFQIGASLTQHTKHEWKIINFKYKSWIICLLFPLVVVFLIIGKFFKYAAMLLPLLIESLLCSGLGSQNR